MKTEAYAAVDPFIGTGGEGHTFPGAVVPFGMIQLSPDTQIATRSEAYGWSAGYRYEDHTIVGLLAYALLRHRALGSGRRAGDADHGRGEARAR